MIRLNWEWVAKIEGWRAKVGLFLLLACDLLHRWLLPIVSFVALISGTYLTYDFAALKLIYPNWDRAIDLIVIALPFAFLVSALAALGLSLLGSICNRSIKILKRQIVELKRENEVLADNIRNLFDGYLYQLSSQLGFGSDGISDERITIYIDSGSGYFVPFGRYSANPQLAMAGRAQYPVNQGCIGRGWTNGWHFENNLGRSRSYVKNTRTRYSMSEATINGLSMRSELYAVKRINSGVQPLAVIVVECLRRDKFDSRHLKSILDREEGVISELIGKLKQHIPDLSFARARGF